MTAAAQGAIEISVEAGENLSDLQFRFVKISAGKAVAIDAATDIPVGVLQEGVASGRMAPLVIWGPTKLEASAAITTGQQLGPSANGRADQKIAGTDTTEYVGGTALEDASSAGDVFHAVVNCITPHRAS